jgi:hypothetical protein
VARPVRSCSVRTKKRVQKPRQNEPRLNQLLIQFDLSAEIKCCTLPTWWLWRGGCTRSHSEHGRETPLRQWYFVLRRGRVGRCQVCKVQQTLKYLLQTILSPSGQTRAAPKSGSFALKQTDTKNRAKPGHNHNAGWSSPRPFGKRHSLPEGQTKKPGKTGLKQ